MTEQEAADLLLGRSPRDRRQDTKREFEAYRWVASDWMGGYKGSRVSEHAHVHPLEDGAFVEVQVWVPRDTMLIYK